MNKDATVILLVIFLLLGLAWDPIRKSSVNSGGSGGLFSLGFFPSSAYNTNDNLYATVTEKDISNQIQRTEDSIKDIQKNLDYKMLESNHSKYYKKITISYVSYLNNPDPNKEYVSLYSNLDRGVKVDMTGWRLVSERSGNWVKIGKVTTTPVPFAKDTEDVIVQEGETINVVKGFSPIGTSFRTNKCTGYFEEDRDFYPGLQRSCPLARDEMLPKFSTYLDRDDECRDLVDNVPACTTPKNTININRLEDTVTSACKEYLFTKINYNSCVANHYGDTNFPGKEWYVYMNLFGPLWRDKRETIVLYDNQNLIVDWISY